MADIFISYARADKERVAPLVSALESEGWSVWWDPAIAPGQEFDQLITEELERARAVVVVWTASSVASRWVRGEARLAADRGVLVPVRFDEASLPLDARALHTTELDGWNGDRASAEFQGLRQALGALLGGLAGPSGRIAAPERAGSPAAGASILVLPFANMSGDPEQEYFSDGICEDIITDLSKVSSLWVAARNTSFTFKGKPVDVRQVARQMKVSHVLEGSVRKSGNRVRITAQLIDGAAGGHVWAERFDRDLSDIFALQDEISQAIVAALKIRLLPEEKRAIGNRGTTNPEAYKLYLMARQYRFAGNAGSARSATLSIRLCRRAVEVDPDYARAWALMAICQASLKLYVGAEVENGAAAAERAIALNPDLADAHAARGRILTQSARYDEAFVEIQVALRLDPDSYEANREAAALYTAMQRLEEAVPYYERAAGLLEFDYWASGMVITIHERLGHAEQARDAARRTLARVEKMLASEPDHGSALSFGITALVALGEDERAREWIERALLLDPDNLNMGYNVACSLIRLGDHERALGLLEQQSRICSREAINWWKVDPELDPLRGLARFQALLTSADGR
ncbi:MAG: TIR domain-containing protein [Steroidobacteraceae bacterium]